MAQYIDKAAVVAEINRVLNSYDPNEITSGRYALVNLREFLDTIEVKDLPIWEKVSPDTGQTTLYKDGDKSYLERFGYRIDLKDLDKLPKKNLKSQKGE